MIGIMLVSKQEPVLNLLRQFIEYDNETEVVAEASGGDQALEKVENSAPDVLIINPAARIRMH